MTRQWTAFGFVPLERFPAYAANRVVGMVRKQPIIIHKELLDRRALGTQAVSKHNMPANLANLLENKNYCFWRNHMCRRIWSLLRRSFIWAKDLPKYCLVWWERDKSYLIPIHKQVWRKENEEFNTENIIPAMKYEGGNVIVKDYFSFFWQLPLMKEE